MEALETKIAASIGESPKTGIYETFVKHQDYYDYFNLGESPTPNQHQKMYLVVWEGQVERICLEERRAWAELRGIFEEEGVEFKM